MGTALSARAAQGLGDGAGIPSTTLARLLRDVELGRTSLGPEHVVVLDEAGMVGTRQLGQLLDSATKAGAKVVLVGDPRQLPEIEAGGAVAGLIERIGAIELTGNHRQKEAWARAALDELRHGNPVQCLVAFEHAGQVHVAPSMAEARALLVDGWLAAHLDGQESTMLAVNRTDVTGLNQLARQALQAQGSLGPDVTEIGGMGLAIGDDVLCLQNDPGLLVLNGTQGTIRAISDEAVTITVGKDRRRLPIEYVVDGHLAHGYATTIHKAQGLTVDRAFVLATDSLTREAGYVAMSRARHGADLFVPTSAFEDGVTYAECEQPDPLHAVEKRFLVSRTKQLATDDLPALFATDRSSLPETRVSRNATDHEERPEDRYLVSMLGRRPTFLDERVDYDQVARAISSYRDRFSIEDERGIGGRPLEAYQRSAYESVRSQVRSYQRRLGLSLELEGPSRGIER